MYFKGQELRSYYNKHNASSVEALNESSQVKIANFAFDSAIIYDIFLSNRFVDKETVSGLAMILRDVFKLSVYIDWEDNLDRNNVNKETADIIRERLDSCKCLLYVASENAAASKWMPWEVGYMDGKTGKVAICPIVETSKRFEGREYLSLYPYITRQNSSNGCDCLWVNDSPDVYVNLKQWLKGDEPYKH